MPVEVKKMWLFKLMRAGCGVAIAWLNTTISWLALSGLQTGRIIFLLSPKKLFYNFDAGGLGVLPNCFEKHCQ